MKNILILVIILGILAASCTTVDPAHRGGKRAYASQAPKNKSAWKK